MAHYAYLDADNIVTQVIVGKNETDPPGNWEVYYGAKRTSYNTRGGVHYDPVTNEPSDDQTKAFRKNYASIGYSYDPVRDAFIPPKPFASWVLNEQTCLWEAPKRYPVDGKPYYWSENENTWLEDSENAV